VSLAKKIYFYMATLTLRTFVKNKRGKFFRWLLLSAVSVILRYGYGYALVLEFTFYV